MGASSCHQHAQFLDSGSPVKVGIPARWGPMRWKHPLLGAARACNRVGGRWPAPRPHPQRERREPAADRNETDAGAGPGASRRLAERWGRAVGSESARTVWRRVPGVAESEGAWCWPSAACEAASPAGAHASGPRRHECEILRHASSCAVLSIARKLDVPQDGLVMVRESRSALRTSVQRQHAPDRVPHGCSARLEARVG